MYFCGVMTHEKRVEKPKDKAKQISINKSTKGLTK